jgi:hypothetical protein
VRGGEGCALARHTSAMGALSRLRGREPAWRRAQIWVPAPEPVVEPEAARVDRARLKMPAAFRTLDAPPVFVCGCARSGTTWTLDLFGRHPRVAAVSESWLLCQTGGLTGVLAQPFWNVATKEAWERRVDVPFGATQLLSYEEVVREIGDLLAGWLMRAVDSHHRFLVAKEPLDVAAAAILFPEARFVHVLRDGRDVALSMGRAADTWAPAFGVGLSIELRAEAWRRQVENVRAHRGSLGDRYLEVRYEDMRRDTAASLRGLFDFAEIPYDDELLATIRAGTELSEYDDYARTSGFRGGGSGPGGWRDQLSRRELARFMKAGGELLAELGYEASA